MSSMPAPLYKYLDPEHARKLISEGSIKIGTLSEYRAMEGLDAERGDGGEGEVTLHSPAGRRVYGGAPANIPPPLRQPGIHIGPGGLVTEGENAITLQSRIPDMFIYCTTEAYDPDYGPRFGNGAPVACVRIEQPESFFLALDTAFRAAVSASRLALSEPRWGRCEYQDRRHNWEREDLPAIWLLKPVKFQGQREIRVHWETKPVGPLKYVVLQAPAIIPYCSLLSPM